MPMIFGGAFVLTLVMATTLALLMQLHPALALLSGLTMGGLLGLTLIATSLGISYLFARNPFSLWLIDAGYMVAMMGAWRQGRPKLPDLK